MLALARFQLSNKPQRWAEGLITQSPHFLCPSYMIFAPKINKFLGHYVTFARKMPEFYNTRMFARKIFSRVFLGGGPLAPSPMPMAGPQAPTSVTFDLLTPKHNQFILAPGCTTDKNL